MNRHFHRFPLAFCRVQTVLRMPLVVLFLFLLSCEQDTYDKGTGAYSLMQAELVEAYASVPGLLSRAETDESQLLNFSQPYEASWATTADSAYRALLYYNKVEEKTQVVSCSQVSTAVILPLDSFKQGVRQDPVRFESAWVSSNGRYLNTTLFLMTGTPDDDEARHLLAVADDSVVVNADGTRTQQLLLYHYQGRVPEYYSQRLVISVPLHNVQADSIAFAVNTYDGTVVRRMKK